MRNKLMKCVAIVGIFLISTIVYSQSTRIITGTTSDQQGNPLPGVNVIVQGTTVGTITNVQGEFTLEVTNPDQSSLVFSFIGFENQVVPIGTQSSFNIVHCCPVNQNSFNVYCLTY